MDRSPISYLINKDGDDDVTLSYEVEDFYVFPLARKKWTVRLKRPHPLKRWTESPESPELSREGWTPVRCPPTISGGTDTRSRNLLGRSGTEERE